MTAPRTVWRTNPAQLSAQLHSDAKVIGVSSIHAMTCTHLEAPGSVTPPARPTGRAGVCPILTVSPLSTPALPRIAPTARTRHRYPCERQARRGQMTAPVIESIGWNFTQRKM